MDEIGKTRGNAGGFPQSSVVEDSGLVKITTFVSVSISLIVLIYSRTKFVQPGEFTVGMLGLGLVVFFLIGLSRNNRQTAWDKIDYLFMILLLVTVVSSLGYFFLYYANIQNRVLSYRPIEYVLAAVVILVVLEATRRSYGRYLVIFALVTLIYAYIGPALPDFVGHEGVSIRRLLEINVLTLRGTFGFIPQVGVTWVAIFLVFGGLLEAFGMFDLINSISHLLSAHIRSGIAQLAVFTSLLLGTIIGVAAANTATSGSFTIPLMKKNGLEADTAGAIESVASTGGQVMPPIMGISAFVMASILGVPYLRLIGAGLLPALLFYGSLVVIVHIVSVQQGIKFDYKHDHDLLKQLHDGIPIIISVVVLVYFIAWERYGLLAAAFNGIGILIALQALLSFISRGARLTALRSTAVNTIHGLRNGGIMTARLLPAITTVAIMVETIQVSSIIQDLTFYMLNLFPGQLLVFLVLASGLSLLLGMGAPTLVAYIIVAILVGPVLTQFGLNQLYGHFFVFYFAVLSSITPPFAIACLVSCSISGAGFLETCSESMKIATPLYLLPFAFVIHENLLIWNEFTLLTLLIVFIGLISSIGAVAGHPSKPVSIPLRLLFITAALLILLTDDGLLNALGTITALGALIYVVNPTPIIEQRLKARHR